MNNKIKKEKIKTIVSILELSLLALIVIGIPIYIWFFHQDFLSKFTSLEDITAYLNLHKGKSIIIYIGVQILQIIISIIPGQVFQFAAGYVFGFWQGLIYSIIGAGLGTAISYYIAKLLGHNAVITLLGEEKIGDLVEKLNSRMAYNIVFILYLVPGIPKDVVSYAAGISKMRFKTFFPISILGRIPAMAGSLLIGSLYYHKHYTPMIIIAIISVILFCLGIVFRHKLSQLIDKFYSKIS